MALMNRYSSMSFADCLLNDGREWDNADPEHEAFPDPLVDQLQLGRREFAVPPGIEVCELQIKHIYHFFGRLAIICRFFSQWNF